MKPKMPEILVAPFVTPSCISDSDVRRMLASWQIWRHRKSRVVVLEVAFGLPPHGGGVRLSSRDSQLMRALKRPRADHINAHAVVSSSGEPEVVDGRNFTQLNVHCIRSPQLL
jgi:hypothetical protein